MAKKPCNKWFHKKSRFSRFEHIDVTVGVVHCSLLFANDCDFFV